MGEAKLLLELTPKGQEIVEGLRLSANETEVSVILRALTMLQAVQPYMEGNSLVVVNPSAPLERDLVELRFQ